MSKPSEQSSREMVAKVREEVKQREKAIRQRLMVEERELWLDESPEDQDDDIIKGSWHLFSFMQTVLFLRLSS